MAELEQIEAEKEFKFNPKAKEMLEVGIVGLITLKPILGTVFLHLNARQSPITKTMAVGVIRKTDLALYYNPEWVLTLTSSSLEAVLIHEAMHVLLHHISRADYFGYNMLGFNISADMAINGYINDLPKGAIYPDNFGLPKFNSAEWYYESLKKEAQKEDQQIPDFAKGKGELVDDHSQWSNCDQDIISEKIRGMAEEGVKAQEVVGWSKIGSNLAKAILDANKPIINWKREVRWFINKLVIAGSRKTRSRISRREQSLRKNRTGMLKNVYTQPGLKRDFRSKLLVAIDTSGSVSDAEIKMFLGEINGMCNHVECHVVMFDTQILGQPIEITKKIKDFKIMGRGGTSFEPAIKYVDEHGYDGLVMLTDGEASFPAKPKARVLWALSPSGASVVPPYGKRVVIDLKGK